MLKKHLPVVAFMALALSCFTPEPAPAKTMNLESGGLYIPLSRSELVNPSEDVAQVLIADPDISDVTVIGSKRLIFVGKKQGRTNAKLFAKDNKLIRQFDIIVGYDLPAIRKALHFFLPHERIAVDLVNTNVALSGEVSDASVATKAVEIVNQFVAAPAGAPPANGAADSSVVLNLLKVASGQQVMLQVRVGEIQRTALKNLGVDIAASRAGSVQILGGSIGGVNAAINASASGALGAINVNDKDTGILASLFNVGKTNIRAALEMLETEGLFKSLAEPNLVAISGEKAEFLAGGEFPIPVAQTAGSAPITTVTFKDYGVAVQFVPFVMSQNRIRIAVAPEVSEIDTTQSTTANGISIPGLTTRRAKTTVELAPGESFMIAGLISDHMNSTLSQIPGASEIPILGALLRSTTYQRNETELVIAVTPYLVDPLKAADVRLPVDDFRPASMMEQFFYGTLGSMSGDAYRTSQTPSLEGPIGFMMD